MSTYLLPPGFGARKKASKGLEGKDLGLAAVLAAAVVLIDQATGEHLYRTFSKIMDWLEGARDARQALKDEIARLEASLRNAEMRERQVASLERRARMTLTARR